MEHARYTFALVSPRFTRLAEVLRVVFEHPWVASYQIGFGPPLVRANAPVTAAVKAARSALDKLSAYATHCLFDRAEQARLAALHRQLLVRRHGPIEAEEAALRAADVLDLSLRLFTPASASPAIRQQMLDGGVDPALGAGAAPELLSGRFLVRLEDPRNERLLELPVIAAKVPPIAPLSGEPMVLELSVDPALAPLWRAFTRSLEGAEGIVPVELGDPASLARSSR